VGNTKSNEDFSKEIQDIKLIQKMGVQMWIGRRSIQIPTSPNLFMIEPIQEDVVVNQEDPINYQDEIPRGEVEDDSPTSKKRSWLLVDKNTCWELVVKAQMMVDVELICDTKVTTNDDNGEQKWRDVWGDLNCLQFVQTG
jgi:hypothetical protein